MFISFVDGVIGGSGEGEKINPLARIGGHDATFVVYPIKLDIIHSMPDTRPNPKWPTFPLRKQRLPSL